MQNETSLSTDPDASVLMLKSLVDGIADVSSIWDVVREKIIPNFQIWNILLDKGDFWMNKETNKTKKFQLKNITYHFSIYSSKIILKDYKKVFFLLQIKSQFSILNSFTFSASFDFDLEFPPDDCDLRCWQNERNRRKFVKVENQSVDWNSFLDLRIYNILFPSKWTWAKKQKHLNCFSFRIKKYVI